MSEQDTNLAEAAGPYSVFLQHGYGYGIDATEANIPAVCAWVLGALGLCLLVSVGFSGNFLVLVGGMASSVIALVFGAYGLNVAEWAGRGRAGAIVGMSLAGLAIVGSASLAVFAVWQTP